MLAEPVLEEPNRRVVTQRGVATTPVVEASPLGQSLVWVRIRHSLKRLDGADFVKTPQELENLRAQALASEIVLAYTSTGRALCMSSPPAVGESSTLSIPHVASTQRSWPGC